MVGPIVMNVAPNGTWSRTHRPASRPPARPPVPASEPGALVVLTVARVAGATLARINTGARIDAKAPAPISCWALSPRRRTRPRSHSDHGASSVRATRTTLAGDI